MDIGCMDDGSELCSEYGNSTATRSDFQHAHTRLKPCRPDDREVRRPEYGWTGHSYPTAIDPPWLSCARSNVGDKVSSRLCQTLPRLLGVLGRNQTLACRGGSRRYGNGRSPTERASLPGRLRYAIPEPRQNTDRLWAESASEGCGNEFRTGRPRRPAYLLRGSLSRTCLHFQSGAGSFVREFSQACRFGGVMRWSSC